MPSVVPSTTAASDAKRAASTTVATCVLSPISARKNATTVTPKTPHRVAGGGSPSSSRSGSQRPDGDGEEGKRDEPREHVGRHERADQVAEKARERMVGECRDQDAGDDRPRLPEARGEHEREELGLVADLAERHHPRRDEKGFHGYG